MANANNYENLSDEALETIYQQYNGDKTALTHAYVDQWNSTHGEDQQLEIEDGEIVMPNANIGDTDTVNEAVNGLNSYINENMKNDYSEEQMKFLNDFGSNQSKRDNEEKYGEGDYDTGYWYDENGQLQTATKDYHDTWGAIKGISKYFDEANDANGLDGTYGSQQQAWTAYQQQLANGDTTGGKTNADNNGENNILSDMFGKTSGEIIDEYSDTIDSAKAQHDNAWQNQIDLLTDGTTRDDGSERTISSSLDQYDTTMDELNDTTTNQLDAQKNYNDYMNPYTQQQIDEANQAIAGASGAKLQSSATQNAIYQNTANMQGSAVNNATSDALTDASNTLSNVNTQSQVAGNLLTADATPQQDIMNANQDWANENLETAVNMANTIAGTESGDNGILGNLNIVSNTLGNKNKS